jgi:glycosyltransferase involved in cell wall biosynthesis
MARPGAFIESHRLEEESLPLVSIITRTYQGRELLVRQALLSVAHQTYPSIEHIVVQDGGDSMHEVTEGIAKLTGRDIKFIGLKKCGRSAIGNAGLSAAKGKWCLFLDDDDLLFCDHIETLVDAIKKDPNVVASYSLAWEIKTDLIANNSSITGYTEVISDIPTVIKQTFSQKILSDTNYLPIQSVLFERNLFETRGGFDEDLDALEDWLLWNRYAKDNSFAYVEKCTSMYRTPYNLNKALQRNNAFMDADSIVRKRIKLLYGTDSLSKPKTMLFPIGSFYSPIVDAVDIENRAEKIWNTSDATPGIEMNLQNQLALLKVLKPYLKTINYPIEAPKDPTIYFYKNDQYPVLDAEFLYSALCHFKPQNVIEVGSGFSSLITADVNRRILNHSIDFTCIEPYPRQFLIDGVEGVTRLVVQKVEDVELSFFNCLGDNDILLIDSSHVSKTGSDVNYLFLKVLPNLRPGVIVHIHDIFLPDDYPKEWVINEGRNWNEQYLLQAFMIGNTEWEVIWAANFLGTRYVEAIQDTFPNYPKLGGGGSFWIQKRNNS